MRPTQGTGSHLLLQNSTTASTGEAGLVTECSNQSSNRERFHQIRRPCQGQLVLWKDIPSLLGIDDQGSTRDSPTVPIFCTSLLYRFCFFLCLSLLPVSKLTLITYIEVLTSLAKKVRPRIRSIAEPLQYVITCTKLFRAGGKTHINCLSCLMFVEPTVVRWIYQLKTDSCRILPALRGRSTRL
ncbi:hypothetical protein FOFC_20546 [Fusarium oxysporum]|nr:hypothetical protein FOFC_20546 [Fusarium oxysporum]